jgi:hypothetical protein
MFCDIIVNENRDHVAKSPQFFLGKDMAKRIHTQVYYFLPVGGVMKMKIKPASVVIVWHDQSRS